MILFEKGPRLPKYNLVKNPDTIALLFLSSYCFRNPRVFFPPLREKITNWKFSFTELLGENREQNFFELLSAMMVGAAEHRKPYI